MAAPKKRSAARRKSTPHVEVSLTRHAALKLKPYAVLFGMIAAIFAACGMVWTGWITLGGPTPVSNRTLEEFKGDVAKQLSVTKIEVLGHSDKNTAEVKRDVGVVNASVDKLGRTILRSQIENLEAQETNLVWSQRPQLVVSIASIEKQLQERPGDQWLMQRKGEVDNALRTIDGRITDTRERLRRLKEQL